MYESSISASLVEFSSALLMIGATVNSASMFNESKG